MDVRYPPSLERAAQFLRARFDSEVYLRERSGLHIPTEDVIVSWAFPSNEGISLPMLALAEPTEDGFLLSEYFRRVIGPIVGSEPEALAILAGNRGEAPVELEAIIEAGAGALRRFDQEGAARTIDTMRTIEWYTHDTSPYHTRFVEQMDSYHAAKRTMTESNRLDYAGFASDLGEEMIAREIIRCVRSGHVTGLLTGTPSDAPFTNQGWMFIKHELVRIYDIPTQSGEDGLVVTDERTAAPLLEAQDRVETILETYPQIAYDAIGLALEHQPSMIARADRDATSPGEWIRIVSQDP